MGKTEWYVQNTAFGALQQPLAEKTTSFSELSRRFLTGDIPPAFQLKIS